MSEIRRIALVTDFGAGSLYVGQMLLRLSELVPEIPVVDLVSNLPPFRPDLSAYLLSALVRDVPDDTLFLCVVDPGVGGGRSVIHIEADRRCYVGPDNGLMSVVARRGRVVRVRRVTWRPGRVSASFHGRDLFCPVVGMLVRGERLESLSVDRESIVGSDWPDDLAKVVFVDGYGNLISGMRASALSGDVRLRAAGTALSRARTFCEVPHGTAFWYENSLGLVELAVNKGRADLTLGLEAGDPIDVLDGSI